MILYCSLYWISPTLSLILTSFLAFFVLSNAFRKGTVAFYTKDRIYLIYLVLAFFSGIPNIEAISSFIRFALYPFLIMIIFQNLTIKTKYYNIIILILAIILVFIAGLMFFQTGPFRFDFSIHYILKVDRNKGFYFMTDLGRVGPTKLAYILATIFILVLSRIKYISKHKIKVYSSIILLIPFILIVAGRNSWIGLFLFILIYAYRDYEAERNFQKYFIFFALIGIIIVGYLFLEPIISGNTYNRLSLLFEPFGDNSFLTRLYLWNTALDIIAINPIGVGYNYFVTLYMISPHNELLAQLMGAGWLGAFFFILFYFVVFLDIKKELKVNYSPIHNYINFVAFSLLVINIIAMMTDNITLSSETTTYPVLMVVIGLSYSLKNKYLLKTKFDIQNKEDRNSTEKSILVHNRATN